MGGVGGSKSSSSSSGIVQPDLGLLRALLSTNFGRQLSGQQFGPPLGSQMGGPLMMSLLTGRPPQDFASYAAPTGPAFSSTGLAGLGTANTHGDALGPLDTPYGQVSGSGNTGEGKSYARTVERIEAWMKDRKDKKSAKAAGTPYNPNKVGNY